MDYLGKLKFLDIFRPEGVCKNIKEETLIRIR